MKVTVSANKPVKYPPKTVTIVLESKEDEDTLVHLLQCWIEPKNVTGCAHKTECQTLANNVLNELNEEEESL